MILYEGPSLLDPSVDIVVIATEDSNPKTGRMLYTWILRQDRAPEVAAYDGSDDAICGDCKFRAVVHGPNPNNPHVTQWSTSASRTCYVRLSPAEGADEALPPSEVWRKWKAGDFDNVTVMQTYYEGKTTWRVPEWTNPYDDVWNYTGPLPVRIGSYGDPAAVPTRVWAELLRHVTHWTGYTHMWRPKWCGDCAEGRTVSDCRNCWKPDLELRRYCMASVDTPEEREEAQALGWRTFFVVPEFQKDMGETTRFKFPPIAAKDILCPATDPHPKRNATCSTCLLCRGTSAPAPSIWEVAHGKNKENHTW